MKKAVISKTIWKSNDIAAKSCVVEAKTLQDEYQVNQRRRHAGGITEHYSPLAMDSLAIMKLCRLHVPINTVSIQLTN
jgi:hypothetical protein